MKKFFLSVFICSFTCMVFTNAMATSIRYEAVDLVDISPGLDLWQYRYFVEVSDVSHPAYNLDQVEYGDYLTIQFKFPLYSDLELVSLHSDWDVRVFQPTGSMFDVGLLATAQYDEADLSDPIVVNFLWFGSDSPGAQLAGYQCMEASGEYGDAFSTEPLASPVPEPATILLLGTGLAGCSLIKRKRQTKYTRWLSADGS